MVPSRLLDLGFKIMAGTYIGLELSGGEIKSCSVYLLIRKYVLEDLLCARHYADLTRNVPIPCLPHPPGHPAQHVPDQVTHQLTKSPGIDRTKCSGVSGSPHSSP